jgi:MFS family permease
MSRNNHHHNSRALLASFMGTSIEFYDFYIYATAASLVLGGLFFPSGSPQAQQLAAFATLAVAFIARPIGAVLFGHFGDRIGRKSTLVVSLLTMGLSTTLIAVLPTYAQAGLWAPLALCLLRFGQGLGLGGEWGGAALVAVENAPPGWRARYGMFPQLGAPAGLLAANGLFLLMGAWLSPEQFRAWGWRIPFALSSILVIVGLWVRLRLAETPAFTASLRKAVPPKLPLATLIRFHWRGLAFGTFGAIGCFALYYIVTSFTLSYATRTLGYPMQQLLGVQLAAIPFLALGIAFAACLADALLRKAGACRGMRVRGGRGACPRPDDGKRFAAADLRLSGRHALPDGHRLWPAQRLASHAVSRRRPLHRRVDRLQHGRCARRRLDAAGRHRPVGAWRSGARGPLCGRSGCRQPDRPCRCRPATDRRGRAGT